MSSASPPSRCFRDLLVWQKAHQFTLAVYRFTAAFPAHETYGLSSQMRRAAVSIAANLAEGYVRKSRPDKARFLNIAEGSAEESRYFLILASDLGYGATTELMHLLVEVSKLLTAYSRAVLAARAPQP